jgi:DNA-binding response OmpR family regulator
VHSRDFLLTRFWGVDFDGGDATLIVAIHRLREKLWSDAHLVETISCV